MLFLFGRITQVSLPTSISPSQRSFDTVSFTTFISGDMIWIPWLTAGPPLVCYLDEQLFPTD